MQLEQQVCSLELAKHLKELIGVRHENHFYWWFIDGVWKVACCEPDRYSEYLPAFTVAELGEMLPIGYSSGQTFWNTPGRGWTASWYTEDVDNLVEPLPRYYTDIPTYADTEADARAKMLIYLLENKLMEAA